MGVPFTTVRDSIGEAYPLKRSGFVLFCWVAAFALLLAPLVVRLFVVVSTPPSVHNDVVDFILFDGYYYLSVAANWVDLGRSTFDGITATNGYQPLWFLVLSGLARLVGTAPERLFVAACALIYGLALLGPLLSFTWRRSTAYPIALCLGAGLALVIVQQPQVFIEGLEPILFAVVATPLIMVFERSGYERKTLLALSALLAVAFLVRLDSLALFASIALCIPLFEIARKKASLNAAEIVARYFRVGLTLSIFVVPTVLVYAAINQWLFATPVPVSGIAKLIGAPSFSNWGISVTFFGHWKSAAVLGAIVFCLEVFARRLPLRPGAVFYRSLLVALLTLGIQYFYYGAFSGWPVWPWYTYMGSVAIALLLARVIYLAALFFAQAKARTIAIVALSVVSLWAVDRSVVLITSSLPAESLSHLTFLRALKVPGLEPSKFTTPSQMSIQMLDDFFKSKRHTLVAMGDRADGLAYWGREKLSVVQTEGLLLDSGYIKARIQNAGTEYLERFPLDYFVVDREVIPTAVGPNGEIQFVVPDPIQGRVTSAPVPTFCFPPSAVRYRTNYTTYLGINTRIAFQFADREACGAEALASVRSIETGVGLRQFSLPGEYRSHGGADKSSEDRDRRIARLRLSHRAR